MIELIVAGAGEDFYRNFYPAVKLVEDINIVTVIDVLPLQKLHEKTKEIIKHENIDFLQYSNGHSIEKLKITDQSAGVVLTPNGSHLFWATFFVSQSIPVYVEKPAVASLNDLTKFIELARLYPNLLYCAESAVDGKALGLLACAGMLDAGDPRMEHISFTPASMVHIEELFRRLGSLKNIHGRFLEGAFGTGSMDHRNWLKSGEQGGVIRDLTSHMFGALYDAGLVDAEVLWERVRLEKVHWHRESNIGILKSLQDKSEGETHAIMQGKFLTHYGTPSFKFEVGKYWSRNERLLFLKFERGLLIVSYEKPFNTRMYMREETARIHIIADFYPTLSLLDFVQFVRGKTHGHIGRAVAIVQFNEHARRVGLQSLGLD